MKAAKLTPTFLLVSGMKIALVGRPNVGKSTLFNRLIRTRAALVANISGLTRDRKYGVCNLTSSPVTLIDTGGLDESSNTINTAVQKQTNLALKEADLILFIVDGRTGLTPVDEEIALNLRTLNQPLILVVNKMEAPEHADLSSFYRLGFKETIAIAAEHNLGIAELIEHINAHLPATAPVEELPKAPEDNLTICLLGRPNVGKSTLINRLLNREQVITSNQPGTTRDSIDLEFEYRGHHYHLIDTAGIRRSAPSKRDPLEGLMLIKSREALKNADAVIFMIDATETVTEQDLRLIGEILDAGKCLVIAVNKWDHLSPYQRQLITKELDRRLGFASFVQKHFISALHGTGINRLFASLRKNYQQAGREQSTSKLNQLLASAVLAHHPPMVNGYEIKPRYIYSGRCRPPTFYIHGTRVSQLPESYRRYLENYLRKTLHLNGSPIRIIFKDKT